MGLEGKVIEKISTSGFFAKDTFGDIRQYCLIVSRIISSCDDVNASVVDIAIVDFSLSV